jgi:hypothetical protein
MVPHSAAADRGIERARGLEVAPHDAKKKSLRLLGPRAATKG